MDWNRYKQICDTPGVFSRWMLEQTSELTGKDLAAVLEQILAGAPVRKPSGHRGGAAADMFELTLTTEQAEAIAGDVRSAVMKARTTSGTASRGLGGFAEAWDEYVDHLHRERP